MPIDRNQLLADIKFYLPDSNILTDTQILAIAENVIAAVGDDEDNYAEVLCKSLKACAIVNKSKATVDSDGTKKEKVGDVEIERFQTPDGQSVWDNYIDSLDDLCPTFGYTVIKSIGIKINPGDKIVVNDCPTSSDMYL